MPSRRSRSARFEVWPPLFGDDRGEPRQTVGASLLLFALAELAGLMVGVGLTFSGAVLFPPRTILAASNSGADRVIGTVLLIISPATAAFGPAYGYWKIRRSRAWLILGGLLVMAAIPAVVTVAVAA